MPPCPPRLTARPGATSLAAILAVASLATAAQAQGVSPSMSAEEGTSVLFVPALQGEFVTGLGVESRLALSDEIARMPGTMATGALGYRHYFDDEGRFGLGGHLAGGLTLPLEGDIAPGPFTSLSLGLSFQFRAMNPDFIYALIGAYVEFGGVWGPEPGAPSTPEPQPAPESQGYRLVVGVEGGFGFLGYLDPYIFGESGVRFGLEFLTLGRAEITSLLIGYQLRVDFVTR